MAETNINNVILGLMAIHLVCDPGLQYLSWMGGLKVFIINTAVALVSMPWITKQVDGRRYLGERIYRIFAGDHRSTSR